MFVFIVTAAMQVAFWEVKQSNNYLGMILRKPRTEPYISVNWSIFFLMGWCRLMNKKIGAYGAFVNFIAVFCFALSMLFGFNYGSYFSSMFIAFSFVLMMCGYAYFAEKEAKLAGYVSVAFSAIYTAIILLVYFAQLTTVRLNDLTQQAAVLLDFQQCGLLFNYDLLGYGVMSLATLFAGLTIRPQTKMDKWLKYLLMVHGVFFISCLVAPMLGIFKAESPTWIGIAVLVLWCLYFCPISILSFLYFSNCKE